MVRTIIISKSKRKGKRLSVNMKDFDGIKDMIHHFGSDVGSTFIDHKDKIKRDNWYARHSVSKFWDNIHSPLFFSRKLLWETDNWSKNLRMLSKLLDSVIIDRTK